jgi:hypothetical protein
MTYSQAEAATWRLVGPKGRIGFNKHAARAKRYMVGQHVLVEGKRGFGVLGFGDSWESALADAKAHLEAQALNQDQEEGREEAPASP